MPSRYRLAGALQWGCVAYYLVAAIGPVAAISLDAGMSLSAAFSPLTPLWIAAIYGGYAYVRNREQSHGISRQEHARRVESLVGVLLFTTVGTVGFTAVRVTLRHLGRPLRMGVQPFALANATITLVGVAAALALAYVVDVRWLYSAEAMNPE